MKYVMGDVPMSIKLRTGIKANKSTAHTLIDKLPIWGANMITVCCCARRAISCEALMAFAAIFAHLTKIQRDCRQRQEGCPFLWETLMVLLITSAVTRSVAGAALHQNGRLGLRRALLQARRACRLFRSALLLMFHSSYLLLYAAPEERDIKKVGGAKRARKYLMKYLHSK